MVSKVLEYVVNYVSERGKKGGGGEGGKIFESHGIFVQCVRACRHTETAKYTNTH